MGSFHECGVETFHECGVERSRCVANVCASSVSGASVWGGIAMLHSYACLSTDMHAHG